MRWTTVCVGWLAVFGALASAGCGPDGNDAYVTADEPSATRVEVTLPAEVGDGTAATPVEPNGVVVPVDAIDNVFRDDVVEVVAGTEVRWTNRGRNDHDVLPVDGEGWGVVAEDFGRGAEYAHVFDVPGVYPYFCSLHGTTDVGMIGTIVVTAP